jgi:hypothetical protein
VEEILLFVLFLSIFPGPYAQDIIVDLNLNIFPGKAGELSMDDVMVPFINHVQWCVPDRQPGEFLYRNAQREMRAHHDVKRSPEIIEDGVEIMLEQALSSPGHQ